MIKLSKAKKIAKKLKPKKPKDEKHPYNSKAVKNDNTEQPDKSEIKVYETEKENKSNEKKPTKKGTKKGTKRKTSKGQKRAAPEISRKKWWKDIKATFWDW